MRYIQSDRFLDPDPLLLVAAPGDDAQKQAEMNPRFHSLNQAIVQLVRVSSSRLCRIPSLLTISID